MQNHIILPSLEHLNIFVQRVNMCLVDFSECCAVVLGGKQLNFLRHVFYSLKVLRKYNLFSPCAKPSNGLNYWWLNCRRMVYRFL